MLSGDHVTRQVSFGPRPIDMENTHAEGQATGAFFPNLPPDFSFSDDPVERLLRCEYGAMFVARGVIVPKKIIFKDPDEVRDFQSRLDVSTAVIGEHEMRLQEPAMSALQASIR